MIAYAWLRPGALVPPTDRRWTGSLDDVRACRPRDLALWIDAELWRVELDGVTEHDDHVLAERGRLVERVPGWTERTADDLAGACALRAADALSAVLVQCGRDAEAAAVAAVGDVGQLEPFRALADDRDPGVAVAAGLLSDALTYAAAANAATAAFATRQAVAHVLAHAEGLPPRTPETVARLAPVIADEALRQAAWVARRVGLPAPVAGPGEARLSPGPAS